MHVKTATLIKQSRQNKEKLSVTRNTLSLEASFQTLTSIIYSGE